MDITEAPTHAISPLPPTSGQAGTTPGGGVSLHSDTERPQVGQIVLVASKFATNPDTELLPFKVIAVKRKYFTVEWTFTHSGSYPIDFSIETREAKDNKWVTGRPKAWYSKEHFLSEIAAKKQAREDDLLRGKIYAFFTGYKRLTHDQLTAIWEIIGPLASTPEAAK